MMRTMARAARTLILVAAGVAVGHSAAFAQATTKAPAVPPATPVALDTAGMFRGSAARIGDSTFIAGQPTEAALRQLQQQGVTLVVNLRTPEEMQSQVAFDEAALLKELGIRYVLLPGRGTAEYPFAPSALEAFTAALGETRGKVLLHCSTAARASDLWAAYLIRARGVSVEDALAHAKLINPAGARRSDNGRYPVEDYLGTALPQIKRP